MTAIEFENKNRGMTAGAGLAVGRNPVQRLFGMDWVVRVDDGGAPLFVAKGMLDCVGNIDLAERFSTEIEARENADAFMRKNPAMKCMVKPVGPLIVARGLDETQKTETGGGGEGMELTVRRCSLEGCLFARDGNILGRHPARCTHPDHYGYPPLPSGLEMPPDWFIEPDCGDWERKQAGRPS